MKVKVFSVYDSVGQFYNMPFMQHNAGMAQRQFRMDVNNPQHPFSKSPNDFILFEIGTYDDSTGQHENLQAPLNLGIASSFLEAV